MITSMSIQLICHATEDADKIKLAVEKRFDTKFFSERLLGHWNNPIFVLRADLKKEKAESLLKKIKTKIKLKNFEERSESGEFFFRLSKKALIREEVEEGNDIKFRIGVQTFPANAKKVSDFMRDFWKV